MRACHKCGLSIGDTATFCPVCGCVAETSALRVAAAIEMLHSYSLVHDDLPAMDDSDLRRVG